jgi:hypothetical protein
VRPDPQRRAAVEIGGDHDHDGSHDSDGSGGGREDSDEECAPPPRKRANKQGAQSAA